MVLNLKEAVLGGSLLHFPWHQMALLDLAPLRQQLALAHMRSFPRLGLVGGGRWGVMRLMGGL